MPEEEILEYELHRIVRSKHPVVRIVMKKGVSSVVVTALDSLSSMLLRDRIEMSDADIERMRFARMNLRWPSTKDNDRAVVFRAGKLFSVPLFVAQVAPAINELQEFPGSF